MLEFSVIEISTGAEVPLSVQKFECLPKIGEWISLEDRIFEVAMVIHHVGDQAGTDLYVRYLGIDVDLIDRLIHKNTI